MEQHKFSASKFFDLADFEHAKLFKEEEPVWTALTRLAEYFHSFFKKNWPLKGVTGLVLEPLVIVNGELMLEGSISMSVNPHGEVEVRVDGRHIADAALIMPGAYLFDDRVIIGPGTVVEPGALIKGPTVIGKNCEVRQGAYFRGNALIGDECLVGHATEVKNSIMLNGAKAGHFAYLGDSILGARVNLGAGTKLANLKMVSGPVTIRTQEGEIYETGLRKLGAVLGDGCETGCNTVTSPGTLVGKGSMVLPCVSLPGGYYPPRLIVSHHKDTLRVHEKPRGS